MSGGPPAPGPDDGLWSARFVSKLVHELRTPLASVRIAAGMLGDDARLPPGLATPVAGLAAAVADLDELLEQASALNRIRAGREAPTRAPLDVAALFEDVRAATADELAEAGATLSLATAGAASEPLASDPARLQRALTLLVRSALAAGARRLVLSARLERDGAELALADELAPPPPAEREQLFEPFQSSTRARRRGGGAGLGLPLARALVELAGGELALEPAADGCTVLRLRLRR